MSKKNNKSVESKYFYTGKNKTTTKSAPAESAKNKKIAKQDTGSTVEKVKKHLNVFGGSENKEKLGPVDKTLGSSIKADNKFVHKWGKKVEGAQKREDRRNSTPHNFGEIIGGIGEVFSGAAAAVTDYRAKKIQEKDRREKTFRRARRAARKEWDAEYGPGTKAEQAVKH